MHSIPKVEENTHKIIFFFLIIGIKVTAYTLRDAILHSAQSIKNRKGAGFLIRFQRSWIALRKYPKCKANDRCGSDSMIG